MESPKESGKERVQGTGASALESFYPITKELTYSKLLAKYGFKDRVATKQAWIFFKSRFPNRCFDANYFDQWVHRFSQGYATNMMDSESLESWKMVAHQVDELIRKEILGEK